MGASEGDVVFAGAEGDADLSEGGGAADQAQYRPRLALGRGSRRRLLAATDDGKSDAMEAVARERLLGIIAEAERLGIAKETVARLAAARRPQSTLPSRSSFPFWVVAICAALIFYKAELYSRVGLARAINYWSPSHDKVNKYNLFVILLEKVIKIEINAFVNDINMHSFWFLKKKKIIISTEICFRLCRTKI